MKRTFLIFTSLILVGLALAGLPAAAQHMQYFRPGDQKGIHQFETTKQDTVLFQKLRVKIGGHFTQDFQMLRDQNAAQPVFLDGSNVNQLMKLTDGFNLAMANLNVDVQLSDGIRLNLTTYLSSRHHQDTWVKGGYIQFDKLPFLKSPIADRLMRHLTLKIGDFDVDYGDAHYRRTDGGNAMYNPFVENLILDAFSTEIGGELYYHADDGFLAMAGATNGELNPTVQAATKTDPATGKQNRYRPAFHGKLGYDRQLTPDFRLRLTGSVYAVKSSNSNTLFWGDRTGSHYFLVMENAAADAADNAWSGRFNPQFGEEVRTFSVNPFLKYKGWEAFGTFEAAEGRTITETSLRRVSQAAGEVIYRFPEPTERFWIGARYNTVKAALPEVSEDVRIDRATVSAGWFLTENIMLKGEYVHQGYHRFPLSDIRSGGAFHGGMLEASIGF